MALITFKPICDSCRRERLEGKPCNPRICLCNCHKPKVQPAPAAEKIEDPEEILPSIY